VVGDHGEGLYEHAERWHAILVYETTQHVPLLIRAPGASPHRVDEPVSLVDLMPTILDLAGVEPADDDVRGISLRPALEGDRPARRELYFESLAGSMIYGWQELRGVRYGEWKLIDSDDPELYHLTEDRAELTNQAQLDPDRLASMRSALGELEKESGAGGALAGPAEIDAETLDTLKSLGYVGGSADATTVAGAPHPREMIDLEPELLSAQSAVASGDWAYLEDLCRYTLERNPTNKWATLHIANALLRRGQHESALEHAELARRLYPENDQVYKVLADIHMATKDAAGAYRVLQEGIREAGDNPMLRYFAAVAAFDAGHEDVCTREVPDAVAKFPGASQIAVLDARCEMRGGDRAGALDALSRARDHGFRDFASLAETPDFRPIADDPSFVALIDRAKAAEPPLGAEAPADSRARTTGPWPAGGE
jgi:tetratricopeptide (TPR) repeat protein